MKVKSTLFLLFLFMSIILFSSGCSDDVSGNQDDDDLEDIVPGKTCIPPCWQESKQDVQPSTRYFYGMAYDEHRKVTVLFGGSGEDFCDLGDTWEFDGSWQEIMTQNHPPDRWKPALCYFPPMHCIILFGGHGENDLDDTWKYDGQNWTKIVTTHKPSRRNNAAMTYDEQIGKIILFGGEGPGMTNPYPHTTWLFDGNDWTELDTTDSGLWGKDGCKMVYDHNRQRVVLYGGTAGIGYYDETWEFYDNTWHQAFPAHNPGQIAYYALAYDHATERTVLYGGGPFGGFLDRTWEYDGSDWIEIQPGFRPPKLIDHSMVYDTYRKHMVMCGGVSGIWFMEKGTWFYWGETPTLATPALDLTVLIGLLCLLPLVLLVRPRRTVAFFRRLSSITMNHSLPTNEKI
ncbi:hypothetical protein JXQ70_06310 [bacterium]|nr:hypothetical protein [bacterium]